MSYKTFKTDLPCFACGKMLKKTYYSVLYHQVVTSDGAQVVSVGPECFKYIKSSGSNGYQPPKGGPRLFMIGLIKLDPKIEK